MSDLEKETINIFSEKITQLVQSLKTIDKDVLDIIAMTGGYYKDKDNVVKFWATLGKCAFLKSSGRRDGKSIFYLSGLTEKELIRILSLKAFW